MADEPVEGYAQSVGQGRGEDAGEGLEALALRRPERETIHGAGPRAAAAEERATRYRHPGRPEDGVRAGERRAADAGVHREQARTVGVETAVRDDQMVVHQPEGQPRTRLRRAGVRRPQHDRRGRVVDHARKAAEHARADDQLERPAVERWQETANVEERGRDLADQHVSERQRRQPAVPEATAAAGERSALVPIVRQPEPPGEGAIDDDVGGARVEQRERRLPLHDDVQERQRIDLPQGQTRRRAVDLQRHGVAEAGQLPGARRPAGPGEGIGRVTAAARPPAGLRIERGEPGVTRPRRTRALQQPGGLLAAVAPERDRARNAQCVGVVRVRGQSRRGRRFRVHDASGP